MLQTIVESRERTNDLLARSSEVNIPDLEVRTFLPTMLRTLNREIIQRGDPMKHRGPSFWDRLPQMHTPLIEDKNVLFFLSPDELIELNLIYHKFYLFIVKSPESRSVQIISPIHTYTEKLINIFQKNKLGQSLTREETQLFDQYQSRHYVDDISQTSINSALARREQFFSNVLASEQDSNLLIQLFDNIFYNQNNSNVISGKEHSSEQFTFNLAFRLLTGISKHDKSAEFQQIDIVTILSSLYEKAKANGTQDTLLKGLNKLADKVMDDLRIEQEAHSKSYKILFGVPNLETEDGRSLNTSRNIFLKSVGKAKKEIEIEILGTGTSGTGTLQYKFCKSILVNRTVGADSVEKKAAKKYVDQTEKNMKEATFKVLTQADEIAKKHKNDWFLKEWRIKREVKKIYETELLKQQKRGESYRELRDAEINAQNQARLAAQAQARAQEQVVAAPPPSGSRSCR
ncbi:MAG: hypothetical protein LBB39_02920 [Mycoplasmataceae bacterium]|nr:hypothetical protein [Mycoplasmataceae bacterium]